MRNSKQETIADIVSEMIEFAETDSQTIGRDVLRRRIQNFARRFESAAKREREAGAEAAQICGEIGEMIERESTCKDSLQVGNAAKMREAFENIAEYAKSANCHTEDSVMLEYLNQIEEWAEAALSAPPRNCDVGTAEEQITRHRKWCKSDNCLPGIPCSVCFAKWSQMTYEEGETK